MQAFVLGWDWHALLTRPLQVFQAPIFYPEPNTLTYMDHLLGEAFLAAPILAAFHSVAAAYNALVLFSFAVSGWAVYRLARLCGASRAGSYLAGFLFAFGPYRFANLDLLNQLQTEFMPLGILFGLKFLRRRRARDFAGLMGSFVAQVYFGWYYAYFLAIAIGLLFVYAFATRSVAVAPMFRWPWAAIAGVAVLLVLPVTLPYVQEHRLLPEFRRSLGESALYSADVVDYLKVNRNALLATVLPLPTGGQSYWPGLATMLLGVVASAGALRGRGAGERSWIAGCFLALTVAAFVLSLGPILHVGGARIWIPLPYAALYYLLPGFEAMRAPARFAILVLLGLSVLAALGFDRLGERMRGRAAWPVLVAGLFAVSIGFAWPHGLSVVDLPTRETMPAVNAWLAERRGSEPVLELPTPRGDAETETHALRQYMLLEDGHPRLDGTSGFVSRRYRAFRATMEGFPGPDALQAAALMGAKLIVVHFGEYPAGERALLRSRVRGERRLVPLAEFGTDAVFGLSPPAGRPSPRTSSARFPETR